MSRIAIVAIGGNSLIKDKNCQTGKDQFEAVSETCYHISRLVDAGYEMVITHGNGPQVGFILMRSDLTRGKLPNVPIDFAVADTQGTIGYNIQMALGNEFRKRGIPKKVVTVVTQVIVDKDDIAFKNPTKPIGPFYTKNQAEENANKYGWQITEDAGRGYRRVVPSPIPQKIVEIEVIKSLIKEGVVVIVVGGGGIPVIEKDGALSGVEAVIDKDYASSLLARNLKAELFIILTSVENVYLNYNTPERKAINTINLIEVEDYLAQGHFAEGSMAPKIRAVISFLKDGGKEAIITTPQKIEATIRRRAGTRIIP